MEEIYYSPNELIIKENDINDHALYLIIDGSVDIFHVLEGGYYTNPEFSNNSLLASERKKKFKHKETIIKKINKL